MEKYCQLKKILISILVCTLLVSLCCTLFACNRGGNKPNADTSRADAKAAFVEKILYGRDANWTSKLTDAETAALNNCGDYVVTVAWTNFVADVLYDSSLQTAKLNKLNEAFSGEEGLSVLSDPKNNAGEIIPLLKGVGFTADDVSGLVFDAVCAFVDKASGVFAECVGRLEAIKIIPQTSDARDNLNAAISTTTLSQSSFNAFGANSADVKSALVDAENGLKTLTGFCYNATMLFDDDGEISFLNALSSGALENASITEVATYLTSILDSVSALKNSLTAAEVNSVETALGLLLDKTDGVAVVASATYNTVMKYMKYAYSLVGLLPSFCALAEDAGGYFLQSEDGAYNNLNALLSAAYGDEYVKTEETETETVKYRYNLAVPAAQAFLSALNIDFNNKDAAALNASKIAARDYVKNMFNSVAQSADDYKKKMVIVYIDMLVQPDSDNAVYNKLLEFITYELMFSMFKTAYAQYAGGDTPKLNSVNGYITGALKNMGVTGISTSSQPTAAWYDSVVNAYKTRMDALFGENVTPASGADASNIYVFISDVNAKLDAYFSADIDKIITLANMPIAKVGTQGYIDLTNKLDELGMLSLFETRKTKQA